MSRRAPNASSPSVTPLARARTSPSSAAVSTTAAARNDLDSQFFAKNNVSADSPTSHTKHAVNTSRLSDSTSEDEQEQGKEQGQKQEDMAVSPATDRKSLTDLSALFQTSHSVHAFPYERSAMFHKSPVRSVQNHPSIALKQQDTAVVEPQHRNPEQSQQPKLADQMDQEFAHQSRSRLDRPSTPATINLGRSSPEDILRSEERSKYRSWRQGKAKLTGMSIAASQQRRAPGDTDEVDKRIDAKLLPEMGSNVRSRKTSHYLGLFKDNEPEPKALDDGAIAQLHGVSPTAVIKRELAVDSSSGQHRSGFLSARRTQDEKLSGGAVPRPQSKQQRSLGIDSRADGAHNVPPNLLEEIRNHRHLIPSTRRRSSHDRSGKATTPRDPVSLDYYLYFSII